MSEWEIKYLQSQIERLEKKFDLQNEKVNKESLTRFLWLIVLTNILFWFCLAHIDLRHDFNMYSLKQEPHTLMKSDSTLKNKT